MKSAVGFLVVAFVAYVSADSVQYRHHEDKARGIGINLGSTLEHNRINADVVNPVKNVFITKLGGEADPTRTFGGFSGQQQLQPKPLVLLFPLKTLKTEPRVPRFIKPSPQEKKPFVHIAQMARADDFTDDMDNRVEDNSRNEEMNLSYEDAQRDGDAGVIDHDDSRYQSSAENEA